MIARSKSTTWTAAAVAASWQSLHVSTAQAQQPKVNWKMQSAFGSQLTHLGTSAVRFVKDVEDMTDGNFVIKFHEPGALVPVLECFDAVSKGSVDACWSTPGNYTGKYPERCRSSPRCRSARAIGEFLAWKIFGNGNKLRDEIYAKHGLIAFEALCDRPRDLGLVPQGDQVDRPDRRGSRCASSAWAPR